MITEQDEHHNSLAEGEPENRSDSASASLGSDEILLSKNSGSNDEEEDSRPFVPTEYIKEELKSELEDLNKASETTEKHTQDVEKEEVGSGRDSDNDEPDDKDDAEENGELQEWVGRFSTAPYSRPTFLRTRAVFPSTEAEEMEITPPTEEEIAEKKTWLPSKKKRAFYNPRLWLGGAQVPELFKIANKEAVYRGNVKCFETEVTLNHDDDCGIGSIWKEMRLPEYQPAKQKRAGSPATDRTDFLKGCMRMGSMMDPEKMSVLLGGKHRTEDFCRFALAGMLGILNNCETRAKLRDARSIRAGYRHADVSVRADDMYEVDDELVMSAEVLEEKLERAKLQAPPIESEGAITEVGDIAMEDDAYADTDEPSRPFEELQSSPVSEEAFENALSYVHRNYFANIMGTTPENVSLESYLKWAVELGMTFESDALSKLAPGAQGDVQPIIESSLKQAEDRRKWRTEPMPAPELGLGASVRHSTAELWRHASKRFSSKHMTRLSLLQPHRVLDWLTYVTATSSVADDEVAFLQENNPVVSIAPIPLLYLADLMSDFALKVLSVAASMAIEEQRDSSDVNVPEISGEEIAAAAVIITEKFFKNKRGSYASTEPCIDETGLATPPPWPELVQRPLTVSEEVVLCSEVPINSFRVPLNATNEARSTLDSLRKISRHFLYTGCKMFGNIDPFGQRKRNYPQVGQGKRDPKVAVVQKGEAVLQGQSERVQGATFKRVTSNLAHDRSTAEPSSGAHSPKTETLAIEVNKREECIFDLSGQDLDPTENTANFLVKNIGRGVCSKRLKSRLETPREDRLAASALRDKPLVEVLKRIKTFTHLPSTTVSLHRLAWICLHALGQDTGEEDGKLMSFGSRANYTSFGEFGTPEKVTLSLHGLSVLAGFADQIVRDEAEILMACAAHDDGRPWIDRADVIVISSVRKEPYLYADLEGSSTLT